MYLLKKATVSRAYTFGNRFANRLQLAAKRLQIGCKWQQKGCKYVANRLQMAAKRLHIGCKWQQKGCNILARLWQCVHRPELGTCETSCGCSCYILAAIRKASFEYAHDSSLYLPFMNLFQVGPGLSPINAWSSFTLSLVSMISFRIRERTGASCRAWCQSLGSDNLRTPQRHAQSP